MSTKGDNSNGSLPEWERFMSSVPWWRRRQLRRKVGRSSAESSARSWCRFVDDVVRYVDEPSAMIDESRPVIVSDYEGGLVYREIVAHCLQNLDPRLRSQVEAWLRGGPDRRYLDATTPDNARLLQLLHITDEADYDSAEFYNHRVPRQGPQLRALAIQALSPDAPDEGAGRGAGGTIMLTSPDPAKNDRRFRADAKPESVMRLRDVINSPGGLQAYLERFGPDAPE